MKLLASWIAIALVLSACAVSRSRDDDETELRRIHAGLDAALLKGDASFFEEVFAPEYEFYHHFGRLVTRADNIDYLRKLSVAPTYKIVRATSDDVRVHVTGDTAWVTAAWTAAIISLNTPHADPHEDMGRYTGIYQRRGDRWLLVAEHMSEAPHDRAVMREQALKSIDAYRRLRATPPTTARAAALELMVAEDYAETGPEGHVSNRAAILAAGATMDHAFDYDVRVIDNHTAVETGLLRPRTATSGERNWTRRYTAMWLWRDLRWQLLATHLSNAAMSDADVQTSR